ncbi:MAG: type II secretion system protein [Betaproteobacteria bacterium]|nr:type II secretion system protein [Betaproteobacteria bacterium]
MSMETRSLQRKAERQAGFTLVELMIGVSLTLILMTASGSLLRDYMATAKTIQVAADANADLMNLLRDVRRVFQTSVSVNIGNQRRGCILQFNAGDRADIANYTCNPAAGVLAGVPTDGIGFGLDAGGAPSQAFVNACEEIPAGLALPTGRGGVMEAPRHPRNAIGNWGGVDADAGRDSICPVECAAGSRPVVKYLNTARGEIVQRQVPRRIVQADGSMSRAALNHWGAVLCGVYFTDRQRFLQGLYGENSGAFVPDYMTLTLFLARARFDVLPPVNPADPPNRLSNYIWIHGGLTLEFNDGQEMSVFRCPPPGTPNRPPSCN